MLCPIEKGAVEGGGGFRQEAGWHIVDSVLCVCACTIRRKLSCKGYHVVIFVVLSINHYLAHYFSGGCKGGVRVCVRAFRPVEEDDICL